MYNSLTPFTKMLQLYSFFVDGAARSRHETSDLLMFKRGVALILMCCLKAVFLSPGVDGHGYLHMPLSRNVVGNQLQTNNYVGWFGPNNYNAAPSVCGGGPNSMMSNSIGSRDTMHPEFDGGFISAKGEDIHWFSKQSLVPQNNDVPNISNNIYNQGDIVTLEVVITAPHYGYFTTHICDVSELSGDRLTCDCFQKRPPLKRSYGHPDDKSPLLDEYPERYYFGNNACPNAIKLTTPPNGIRTLSSSNANTHRYNVQLPSDLNCDHCVLLWWWHCAQSCAHDEYRTHAVFSASNIGQDGPGYKGAPNCNAKGSQLSSTTSMRTCQLDSTDFNQVDGQEQFKSCVDIRIYPSGDSGGNNGGDSDSNDGGDSGGNNGGDSGSNDGGDSGGNNGGDVTQCSEVKTCIDNCVADIL